jgi:predicted Fe-S protein YdhL (DUF1289 family)
MAEFNTSTAVPSPCIAFCKLEDSVCSGCFRSKSEIGEYGTASDDRRREINDTAMERKIESQVFSISNPMILSTEPTMADQYEKPSLSEFQGTKVRSTYRTLIKTGREPASTFIGIDDEDLSKPETPQMSRLLDLEVLAYSMPADCDEPNLFIDVQPNGDYSLIIGSYEAEATSDEDLHMLEVELYDWGLTETGVNWADSIDDDINDDISPV